MVGNINWADVKKKLHELLAKMHTHSDDEENGNDEQ